MTTISREDIGTAVRLLTADTGCDLGDAIDYVCYEAGMEMGTDGTSLAIAVSWDLTYTTWCEGADDSTASDSAMMLAERAGRAV